MKQIVFIFGFLVVTILLSTCRVTIDWPNAHSSSKTESSQCPDEWIINRMPSHGNIHDEYFIVNGERRELDEFDLDWVKKHCNIKKRIVY